MNDELVKQFIQNTLSIVESKLDDDSVNSILHYLQHDEYEMAFEGLFLEIMRFDKSPQIDLDLAKKIAVFLKLDEESVFDFDFWMKFKQFTGGVL